MNNDAEYVSQLLDDEIQKELGMIGELKEDAASYNRRLDYLNGRLAEREGVLSQLRKARAALA